MVRLHDRTPPFDWTELFGRDGPVELEIGSGKGRFLAEAARLRPEVNLLGIERAGKYFRRAVHRVLKAGLESVRLLQADAFDVLVRWVPPTSLDAVHVYFPDPWPKKRHAKRRLLREPLYRLAARGLRPGAPLRLASDVEPYFLQATEEIAATGLFDPVPWPEDAPDRQPTSYALKFLREGRTLHYAKFLRRGDAALSGPDPVID